MVVVADPKGATCTSTRRGFPGGTGGIGVGAGSLARYILMMV